MLFFNYCIPGANLVSIPKYKLKDLIIKLPYTHLGLTVTVRIQHSGASGL
jgi:hypothetical protein